MEPKADTQTGGLQKVLGIGFGLAIIIGGVIGVGILRAPGSIAAYLPSVWLILICWLVGGAIMILSALSYAELAAMMPKAGGMYNYAKAAFGHYWGFVVGWFDYIVNAVAPAYYCIVIAEYLIKLMPEAGMNQVVVAVCVLVLFLSINLVGTKAGSVFQQITSVVKVVIFGILIAACFIWGGDTPAAETTGIGEHSGNALFLPFFMALQLILGAYNGWWNAAVFAEEDKEPGKNLPRAFFWGTAIIVVIYLLINAGIFYVVPVDVAANDPLVASKAAEIIFGNAGYVFLIVFALFSLINILNAYMMIPARILYGLGRDNYFVAAATKTNNGGTPVFALLFSGLLQLVLIFISSFDQLFALGSFLGVIILGITFMALLRLRKTQPETHRPYRVWGYPFTPVFSLVVYAILLVVFAFNDMVSMVLSVIMLVMAVPLVQWLVRRSDS